MAAWMDFTMRSQAAAQKKNSDSRSKQLAVGKGTGLGLSISKGLIEGHQGKLSYNSESKHTQFIIEIPISQKNTSSEILTG